MTPYVIALALLSGGAFIQSKSAAPEMRPHSRQADRAWRWLGKLSFYAWIGLLVWGVWRLHWSQPLAGLVLSIAVNALIGMGGPRPIWPGLSMALCTAGLVAAAYTIWA